MMETTEKKYPTVSPEEEGFLDLLQDELILSSKNANWSQFHLQYLRSRSGETPEFCMDQHAIAIYTDVPANFTSERRMDGRFQQDVVAEGHILVMPSEMPYWVREPEESNYLLLSFDPALLATVASQSDNSDSVELIPHFATPDPLIHQLSLSLKAELESGRVGSRLYAETAVTMLAVHLLRYYSTQTVSVSSTPTDLPKRELQQVLDYIHAHLDQEIGLADLAALMQITPVYFCRWFRATVGMSPHQYVLQQRVERAKVLLRQKKISIAEVALRCGFANQSHLTRHFHRRVGTTPKAYRES